MYASRLSRQPRHQQLLPLGLGLACLPEVFFTNFQCLPRKRSGFRVIAQGIVQQSQVTETLCRLRVIFAEHVLSNRKCLPIGGFRRRVFPLGGEQQRHVVEAPRVVGIILPREIEFDLQHSLIDGQRLFELAHHSVKIGEIVEPICSG